MPHILLGYL